MKPCIAQATTLTTPFEDDLVSYGRAGFQAVEFWMTKLESYLDGGHTLDDVRAGLERNGLRAVAGAGQGGLFLSTGAEREAHWGLFARRLGLLKALEVGTLIVAVDFVREMVADDYARASAALAEAADLAGRHGVRLAVEFQKSARFCASLDTTLALIAQSGAANAGVCLDLFHYYTGPSKFEDLAYLDAENLAWLQLCDLSGTPRELAGDSDRILPGEGDFQLDPILDRVAAIGYEGFASLEVLNPMLWSVAADRVADLGYQALTRALGARAAADEPRRGG